MDLENDDLSGSEINSNASESEDDSEQDQLSCAMDEQYRSRSHNINLRNCKPRKYDHLYGPRHMLAMFEQPLSELFMTEQMSLKKGLKYFGKSGADAVITEMRQLNYLNVIKLVDKKSLTCEQKHHALSYLMYLKQKQCG